MKGAVNRTTVCVVRVVMVDSSAGARDRTSRIFPFEPERTSLLPVHPWSAAGFIPMFEQSDTCAGTALDAFAIENSVVNGGSLTPRSQIGQINEPLICASIELRTRRGAIFIYDHELKISIYIK
jgi:hypothetical protein